MSYPCIPTGIPAQIRFKPLKIKFVKFVYDGFPVGTFF